MKKGFSLSEMVIVVVIISIMAAFAIPNYFRGLEKQKERKAVANMQQLAMGSEAWQAATSSGTFSTANIATINATFRTDIMLEPGEGVSINVQQDRYLLSVTMNGASKIIGLGDTGGTVWTVPCCTTDNCELVPNCP